MKQELFLGIDQGSSATKGVLLDALGTSIKEWSVAVPQTIRNERCVEQDPAGLLSSVQEVFRLAQEASKDQGQVIRAWGLSVQRSGVLAWDADTGRVRHPLITWADTRTQHAIDALGMGRERISMQTGLPVLANFAAPKIHLLQRRFLEPKTYVATLDTYLLHLLSGCTVYATEDTMAARTMVYSLEQRGWSEDLCRRFEVDRKRLPIISPSLGHHTSYEDVALMALLGDQQAALLGRSSAANRPLLNLGTIASLSVSTGSKVVQKPGIMTSVLYSRGLTASPGREVIYLVEITSPVTGTVLLEPLRRQWCADSREISSVCNQSFGANQAGLATAYWVNRAHTHTSWPSGIPNVMVCKPEATTQDRVRAVVENVGNIIVRMLEEFSEKGLLGERFPAEIDVAGGCSEVEYLMQYIADVSGHTLHKLDSREAGARGAALAAQLAVNPTLDIRHYNDTPSVIEYRCQQPERRKRYLMWQRMEQDVLSNRLPAHAEIEL